MAILKNFRLKKDNSQLLDMVYPIGSIYISVNTTRPDDLFGGTWEKISDGRVLMGTNTDSKLGTTIDSGLPNITGHFDPAWNDSSGGGIMMYGQNNQAIYTSRPSNKGYWWASPTTQGGAGVNTQYHTRVHFNASRSNSIYGKSNIVQPPAYYVNIWKRIS